MEKVHKLNNSEYKPSSESFNILIFLKLTKLASWKSVVKVFPVQISREVQTWIFIYNIVLLESSKVLGKKMSLN